MHKLLLTFTTALSVGIAVPAQAVTFVNVGDTYTANFNGVVNGNVTSGLTATLTYQLASISGNSMFFNFTVANTSSSPIDVSRVSTFGFDASPNITSAAITAGTVFDVTSSGNVPQLGNREFCATAGSNCAGGGGNGVLDGTSTSGQFRLDFASRPASLTLTDLYVRYQSIDSTALRLNDGSGAGTVVSGSSVGPAVPEPATWAMMLVGFGAMGAVMRRRQRATIGYNFA